MAQIQEITISSDESEIIEWSKDEFEGAFSTDIRRKKRLLNFATLLAKHPGKSIPQLSENQYDVKATYNLLKHPESTPDLLQKGHREKVKTKLNTPGTYLLIEDTSTCSYSSKSNPIEGLGPTGDFSERNQGFELHSVLAVKWDRPEDMKSGKRPPLKILGLPDQQYIVRKRVDKDKKKNRSHSKRGSERVRETDLWLDSVKRIGKCPDTPAVNWIRVCDRGADLYETLTLSKEYGYGFVIRAAQNRRLVGDYETGESTLFNHVKKLSIKGTYSLDLRSRPGQSARKAEVAVSFSRVKIKAPQRPGYAAGSLPPVDCFVVYVKEVNPPEGIKAIEWVLICSEEIQSFEDAMTAVLQYASRWLIEEFHKALKSGLKIEDLQLSNANRLFAAVAIKSIVALRLLGLKEKVRLNPEAPAESSDLSFLELKVLRIYLKRKIETIEELALAIGRLGGHMNRKGDGLPGMITLWRGMNRLKELSDGAQLVLDNNLF